MGLQYGVKNSCHNDGAVPHVVIVLYLITNITKYGNVYLIAEIALL